MEFLNHYEFSFVYNNFFNIVPKNAEEKRMKQRLNLMFGQNHGLALELEKEKIEKLLQGLSADIPAFTKVSDEMYVNLSKVEFILVNEIEAERE